MHRVQTLLQTTRTYARILHVPTSPYTHSVRLCVAAAAAALRQRGQGASCHKTATTTTRSSRRDTGHNTSIHTTRIGHIIYINIYIYMCRFKNNQHINTQTHILNSVCSYIASCTHARARARTNACCCKRRVSKAYCCSGVHNQFHTLRHRCLHIYTYYVCCECTARRACMCLSACIFS